MTHSTPSIDDALAAYARLRTQSIRIFNSLAAEHGLTPTDYSALYFISEHAGVTPTQVAEHIGLSTGAVTTLVDRLETRKLVKRAPNQADRRSIVVKVTNKGLTAVGDAREVYAEAFNAALDADDTERAVQMFEALAGQLNRVATRDQQAS